jgi:hypothetical protein
VIPRDVLVIAEGEDSADVDGDDAKGRGSMTSKPTCYDDAVMQMCRKMQKDGCRREVRWRDVGGMNRRRDYAQDAK